MFSGGITKLSELVVDIFRTRDKGERRIEIVTDPADVNDAHKIRFYEEQPYETGTASLFSYTDNNPASSTYQRGLTQLNGARSGTNKTTPSPGPNSFPAIVLAGDKISAPPDNPALPNTYVMVTARDVALYPNETAFIGTAGTNPTKNIHLNSTDLIRVGGAYSRVEMARDCFLHLTNTAGNNLNHNVFTRAIWNIVMDANGDWGYNAGSGLFYIPASGWYDVQLNVMWRMDGYGGDRLAQFNTNGSNAHYSNRNSRATATGTGDNYPTTNISDTLYLVAGTVCWVDLKQFTAAGLVTGVLAHANGVTMSLHIRRVCI